MDGMRKDENVVPSRPAVVRALGGFPQEEHSFAELWQTVLKRKLIVLGTTVLIFSYIAMHTLRTKPVYESVVRLQIDPSRSSSSLGLEDVVNGHAGGIDSDTMLQTEVKLIQSDSVAYRVINVKRLIERPEFGGGDAESKNVIDVRRLSPPRRQGILGAFKGALAVHIVPGTQLVEVHYRSTDPKLATDLANTVADQYMQRNFQAHYEGAMQVSTWLEQQMQELQTRALQAQQKLADFQKDHNILGADETDNIVTDKLKMLNQQVTEAEADRIVKEAKHRLAETGDAELIAASLPTPTLQTLRGEQLQLKAQQAELNSKFGSGYPKVREVQSQLARVDSAITAEIANVNKQLDDDYRTAAKTESLLRDQFNAQKNAAYKLNEHAVEYSVLKHEVETTRELFDTLQTKLRVAGVTAGLNASFVSVVDPAEVPAMPVEPKVKATLAMGLFGGLLTGLLLAFVTESFDDTVSTSAEVELFTGLPVLCSIPVYAPPAPRKGETAALEKPAAVAPMLVNNPRSQAAEAFRGLRTSILLSTPDRQPKVIAIVSSIANEGKTTVATNLGVSFAQRGESVLLIDADLRRSSLHSQFGLPSSHIGTSTVLTQRNSDGAVITPLEAMPNLRLMPAGPHPPNPAELLGSKRMVEVLQAYAHEYDRVILDTPPILSVADSLALAHLADAVVLVVRSGIAGRKAVLRVRDLLQRSNANLVGIVFNCVNLKLETYYRSQGLGYYYGKGKAGYYSDDGYTTN
jgi:polysaccharide biosynthesis transport protein